LLFINAFAVLRIVISIISEMTGSDSLLEQVNSTGESLISKQTSNTTRAGRLVSTIWSSTVTKTVHMFACLERERMHQQYYVPRFVWYGGRRHFAVRSCDRRSLIDSTHCRPHRLLVHHAALQLYMTDDESQHEHGIAVLCNMLGCTLIRGGFTAWPSHILDILMVLPLSIKRLRERRKDETPTPQQVQSEMLSIFHEAATNRLIAQTAREDDPEDLSRTRRSVQGEASTGYSITADDLTFGLIYLQNLPQKSIESLVTAASQFDVSTQLDGSHSSHSSNTSDSHSCSEVQSPRGSELSKHEGGILSREGGVLTDACQAGSDDPKDNLLILTTDRTNQDQAETEQSNAELKRTNDQLSERNRVLEGMLCGQHNEHAQFSAESGEHAYHQVVSRETTGIDDSWKPLTDRASGSGTRRSCHSTLRNLDDCQADLDSAVALFQRVWELEHAMGDLRVEMDEQRIRDEQLQRGMFSRNRALEKQVTQLQLRNKQLDSLMSLTSDIANRR